MTWQIYSHFNFMELKRQGFKANTNEESEQCVWMIDSSCTTLYSSDKETSFPISSVKPPLYSNIIKYILKFDLKMTS